MSTFWKKSGWLGLAVTALLASLALQILMGVVAMLPGSLLAGVEAGRNGITDPVQIQSMVEEKTMEALPWSVLLYHVISLPVFGVWYYFGCGRPKLANPVKVLKARGIADAAMAGFGMCMLANAIAMLLQYLTPAAFENYMEMMESAGMGISAVSIIAAVLLAPIGEEILCRGIIMHYCRRMTEGLQNKVTAFWIANVLQALIFGIMHGNFVQGTYAFILGMGLGLLQHRYNSLYPAMICHFAVNFLSTFVMDSLFGWLPEGAAGVAIIGVLGLVVTAAALRREHQKEQA